MLQRLAFVDHSFHKKTRSGDFLRALFGRQFEIVDFWDDSWQGGSNVSVAELNAGHFSHVFFFQSLLAATELAKLQAQIVWAPMYDPDSYQNNAAWLALRTVPMKVLCCSRILYNKLTRLGFQTIYAQYWFNPADYPQVTNYNTLRVFFWPRTDITFEHVKALLGDMPVTQCIIKLNPDPHHQVILPSPADMERYHITLVEGFIDKIEYVRLLHQSNIFISPRLYEGIGMSFLEAMAMGLVVVGYNHPTMSEYITDHETGLLFTGTKQSLDFSDLSRLGQNTQRLAQRGYDTWISQTNAILDFMHIPLYPAQPMTLAWKLKMKYAMALYLAHKRLFHGRSQSL